MNRLVRNGSWIGCVLVFSLTVFFSGLLLPLQAATFDPRLELFGLRTPAGTVQLVLQVSGAPVTDDAMYVFERSADGVDFEQLGVQTAADRRAQGWYVFEDVAPRRGHSYYRVRLMSEAGSVLSNVVHLEQFPGLEQFLLYPNPSSGMVWLEFRSGLVSDTQVVVRAPDGRVLYAEMVPVQTQRLEMNLEALPAGMYFVQIMYNNMQRNQFFKLVKR